MNAEHVIAMLNVDMTPYVIAGMLVEGYINKNRMGNYVLTEKGQEH